MKELTSVCKIQKNKTKYKITEMCSEDIISLFNNRSIYIPYIQLLLSELFKELEAKTLYISTSELMSSLGMINKNFKAVLGKDMYSNCYTVARMNQFDEDSFYRYILKSYTSVLKPILTSALNSMNNSKSIQLNKGLKLFKNNGRNIEPTYRYVNETDEIGKEIFSIESSMMTTMNIKGTGELYGRKIYLLNEYYANCNKEFRKLCKENKDWIERGIDFDGYYHCNVIQINKERLAHNIHEIKKEFYEVLEDKMLKTKTLDFLPQKDRKEFIFATIDKHGTRKYDFKQDLKNMDKALQILYEGSKNTPPL